MPSKLEEHVKGSLKNSQLVILVYPVKWGALSFRFKGNEALICECHCTERL